jgi:hypothetical protein
MKKSFETIISAFILMMLIAGARTVLVKGAAILPEIAVIPEKNTANIGEAFTINITITTYYTIDAFRWEIKLRFAPGLLSIMNKTRDIKQGDFLAKAGSVEPLNVDNSTAGELVISQALTDPENSANGNGTLVTIKFTVVGYGYSKLDLLDTHLYKSDFTEISLSPPYDGEFRLTLLRLTPDGGGTAVVQIEGFGLLPSRFVSITWDESDMKVFPEGLQTDLQGNFFALLVVPTPTVSGSHNITATAKDDLVTLKATFTVVAQTGPAGPQGEKGDKGDKGDTGATGAQGTAGSVPLEYTVPSLLLALVALVIAIYAILKAKKS